MSTIYFWPIRVTVISWSFQMLAWMWLLHAPGNWASAYVAPYYYCEVCRRFQIQNHYWTAVHVSLIWPIESHLFLVWNMASCRHQSTSLIKGLTLYSVIWDRVKAPLSPWLWLPNPFMTRLQRISSFWILVKPTKLTFTVPLELNRFDFELPPIQDWRWRD